MNYHVEIEPQIITKITEIIRLALNCRHMSDIYMPDNRSYSAEEIRKFMEMPKEESTELYNYLSKLEMGDIKIVKAIYCIGANNLHGGNTPKEIYDNQMMYFDNQLGWNKMDVEISYITEKQYLGEKLINGLGILQIGL